LAASPDWQAYLKKGTALLVKMENRILIPTSFSPLK
ncbi:MAG: NIPSNAP family protein, partial [Alphaproteobacteria bacterium]|nr:NIPSNAP family protein [Alphaproteobacteria bacterium]